MKKAAAPAGSPSPDKQKSSLVSEATLWELYRRVLGGSLLQARLAKASPAWRKASVTAGLSPAVCAGLTENLLEGDTLALPTGDLLTRYLCGVPLPSLREAAAGQPPSRRAPAREGWPVAGDSSCGLLPGSGEEQATLAVGAALAARLHQSHALTVLLSRPRKTAAAEDAETPIGLWSSAARTATALQLPILFVTESVAGLSPEHDDPRRPALALPSIPVDRDDPLAIYRVVYESTARARAGGGPTWIDCRALPTPDKRCRNTPGAPEPATPLAAMEQVLRSRQFFSREQHRHLQHSLERDFARAGWAVEDRI